MAPSALALGLHFTSAHWPSPCSLTATGQFSPLGLCTPVPSTWNAFSCFSVLFFKLSAQTWLYREALLDPLFKIFSSLTCTCWHSSPLPCSIFFFFPENRFTCYYLFSLLECRPQREALRSLPMPRARRCTCWVLALMNSNWTWIVETWCLFAYETGNF